MSAVRSFLLAIASSGFITCYAQTGPGGVGSTDGTSTLEYWIDANRGVTGTTPITQILDLSGNNITNAITGDPAFIASALNSMGALRFTGDDELATNATINAVAFPQLTVFAVYIPSASPAGSVWGEDNGDWDRFQADINFYSPYISSSVGAGYDHASSSPECYGIPGLFASNTPTFSNVIYREDQFNGSSVRVNGATVRNFTSTVDNYAPSGYSNLYIGAIGSNGFRFAGDIAEVIVYSGALGTAQQLIVENYLSAKYNIQIVANNLDLYRGDDFGYDYDVAGIGREDGISHTDAQGSGIVRILGANNLDDEEFLMWGHNNGPIAATNPDVPNNMTARSNRIWYVSERNLSGAAANVGRVDIRFNLANLGPITTNHLRLLIDTDGDGVYADETAIGSPTSLGNNEYEFNNIMNIADGVTFTIGTTNNATALPVELTDFNVTANQQSGTVTLSWETALEKNNDRFEILRSSNAKDWSQIGSESGAGNSNTTHQYTFVDINPINGQSYYRLRQVDWDGNSTSSDVRAILFERINTLSVFPNPAIKEVIVSGSDNLHSIRVFRLSGLEFTDNIETVMRTDGALHLDISALPSGDYVIVTGSGRAKLVKH